MPASADRARYAGRTARDGRGGVPHRAAASFNKNFELLADDLAASAEKGYRTYILSQNKAQVERLQNIFHQIGRSGVAFTPVSLTLHEGFVDHTLRFCCYTQTIRSSTAHRATAFTARSAATSSAPSPN